MVWRQRRSFHIFTLQSAEPLKRRPSVSAIDHTGPSNSLSPYIGGVGFEGPAHMVAHERPQTIQDAASFGRWLVTIPIGHELSATKLCLNG